MATTKKSGVAKPIKLSPTSLNLFRECPRCFWLEKRMGFRRPPPFPYTLNSAVDQMVKVEFDAHRAAGTLPKLLTDFGIKGKFFDDELLLRRWRNNLQGVRYYDEALDATLFGAVDEVLDIAGRGLAPLDAKATGGKSYGMHDRFVLQLSVYAYLIKQNGYPSAGRGYLAYFVADKEAGFEAHVMPFKTFIFETETDEQLVRDTFAAAVALLREDSVPAAALECLQCKHVAVAKDYY